MDSATALKECFLDSLRVGKVRENKTLSNDNFAEKSNQEMCFRWSEDRKRHRWQLGEQSRTTKTKYHSIGNHICLKTCLIQSLSLYFILNFQLITLKLIVSQEKSWILCDEQRRSWSVNLNAKNWNSKRELESIFCGRVNPIKTVFSTRYPPSWSTKGNEWSILE